MKMSRAVPASVALLLVLPMAGACNPTPASPTVADAQAVCPASPEETVGAACVVPGLRCGPQYTCGIFQVTVLCVCTDGVFQCTDGMGRPIDDGGNVTCPQPSSVGTCPPTERSAQLTGCGSQGLLCSYPSPCSSGLDQCQCFPGATTDGGFGLRFECVPAVCGAVDASSAIADSGLVADAGAPVESGIEAGPDSGLEGGHDEASAVDASEIDAQME